MLWTPAVFGGYYLFGEGQVGMAHPWHLLLYRFFPPAIAFNVEIVSGYAAMFAGVVLLRKPWIDIERTGNPSRYVCRPVCRGTP
jgi:hypothetical protein